MDDRADFPQLGQRLLDRRGEIWETVVSRVHQVGALPADVEDAYEERVRAAALAAIDYGRSVVEGGGEGFPEIPKQLLTQARLAAASGVAVESMVRRYFGGYAAFSAAIIEEAQRNSFSPQSVQQVLGWQAEAFDRLISAVTKEYADEIALRSTSKQSRRLKLIGELLAGAPVNSHALGYELDQRHLGLITSAPQPKQLLLDLGRQVDRQVLVADRRENETWAWLGGRAELRREDLERALARAWPKAFPLAVGEDCRGRHVNRLRRWPPHELRRSPLMTLRDSGGTSVTMPCGPSIALAKAAGWF